MKFKNGQELLDELECCDLYKPETGEYVFEYNSAGSIAVYTLSDDEVEDLKRDCEELGEESWSGLLGAGGYIYDDPSYECYDPENSISNIEWCNDNYEGNWEYAE